MIVKNNSINNKKLRIRNLSKKNNRKSKKTNLKGGLNCGIVLDEVTCRERAPECLWKHKNRRCIDNPAANPVAAAAVANPVAAAPAAYNVAAAAAAARARIAAARHPANPVAAAPAANPVAAAPAANPVAAARHPANPVDAAANPVAVAVAAAPAANPVAAAPAAYNVRAAAAAARARIAAARHPANPVDAAANPVAVAVAARPVDAAANPVAAVRPLANPVAAVRPLANPVAAVLPPANPVAAVRPPANPVAAVLPPPNPVAVAVAARPVAAAANAVAPVLLPEMNATVVDINLIRDNNTFEVLPIFNKFSKQKVMEANRNIDECRAAIALFQTQLGQLVDYTRENLVRVFNIQDAAPEHPDMGVASDRNCTICRIELFANGIKGIRSDNNELFCEQCFQNNIILKPLEQTAFSQAVIPRPIFTPIYHPANGPDSNFSAPFVYNLALNQELSRTLTLYQAQNNHIQLIASIIGANASMAFRYPDGVTVRPNPEITPIAELVYILFYNATIEIAQLLSQRR